jgi:hypothetical protein
VRLLRHEKKYAVPLAGLPALRADLAALLPPDPHSPAGQGYLIRSLYFEDWPLTSLREKLTGLHDRFKLRVRGYPADGALLHPDAPLVAEIKRKRGEAVLKDRTSLTRAEYELLVASRHGELLARRGDDAVLRRFVGAKIAQGSVAPLVIEYRREAFQHPSQHVYLRATLDHSFRVWATPDLFEPTPCGQRFGVGQAILEVKTSGAPPDWLPALLAKHRLDPREASKFAFGSFRTYARRRS